MSDLQRKGIQIRTLDGLINTREVGKLAPLVIGLLTGLSEVEMLKQLQKKDERYKKGIENRFRAKSAVHTENQTN